MASGEQFLSGEQLSKELNISRTAVWKRIAALRREGYPIEASTNKGYRILSNQAHYGKSGILSCLSTSFLGRELKYFNTIDSTNTMLKTLAGQGAPEGTAIVADAQEKGRGRLGRNWMSSPGLGIWMSILLKPDLHPAMLQSLTLAAAVAVCRAIEPFTAKTPGIKWPNDILIDGKKVCGILTEMSAEADRVLWVVIGIGVNVHHSPEDFPEELNGSAASLAMFGKDNQELDRCKIAAGIMNAMEELYRDFVKNGPDAMLAEWKQRSVTLGRKVSLKQGDKTLIARVLDIGSDGRLVIETEDGTVTEILSGEITLRPV